MHVIAARSSRREPAASRVYRRGGAPVAGRLHPARARTASVVPERPGRIPALGRQCDVALLQRLFGLQMSVAVLLHARLRGLRDGAGGNGCEQGCGECDFGLGHLSNSSKLEVLFLEVVFLRDSFVEDFRPGDDPELRTPPAYSQSREPARSVSKL